MAVAVGVGLSSGVGVGVNVAVAVGVGVKVAVAVGVGVNVAVAVGVGLGVTGGSSAPMAGGFARGSLSKSFVMPAMVRPAPTHGLVGKMCRSTVTAVPFGIDELRINRDAVGILTTEGLPIRQAASRRACAPHSRQRHWQTGRCNCW